MSSSPIMKYLPIERIMVREHDDSSNLIATPKSFRRGGFAHRPSFIHATSSEYLSQGSLVELNPIIE